MRSSAQMRIASCAVLSAMAVVGSFLRNSPAAEPEAAPAVDQYGNALPAGIVARLSTVSFRHPCPVYSWAYSPDGTTLVSIAEDQVVRLWSTVNGDVTHKIEPPPAVIVPWPGQIAISPDGKLAAIAYGSVWVRIVELQEGKVSQDIERLRPDVARDGWHAVEFFSSSHLLLGSRKSSFWIDPHSGSVMGRVHPGSFAARSAASDVCAFADKNNALELVRLQTNDGLRFQRASTYTADADRAIALSPDGQKIAVSSGGTVRKDGVVMAEQPSLSIEIYDIPSSKLSTAILIPRMLVEHLRFSPNGEMLVASGPKDSAVWEIRSGERLTELPASPNHLPYVFSPDGSKLSSVGAGTTIAQWNMATLAKSLAEAQSAQ